MTEYAEAAVSLITCARCGATPGQVCVTRSGRWTTYVHSSRINPIVNMWRKGYEEGISDVMAEVHRAKVLHLMPMWMRRKAGYP